MLPALAPDLAFEGLGPPGGLRELGRARPAFAVHAAPAGFLSPLEQPALAAVLRRLRPSLFHATSFSVPLLWRGPLVATLHDAAHLVRSEEFGPLTAVYYRLVVRPDGAPRPRAAHRVRVRPPRARRPARRARVALDRRPSGSGCAVPASLGRGASRRPRPLRASAPLPARGGQPQAAQEPGAARAHRRAPPRPAGAARRRGGGARASPGPPGCSPRSTRRSCPRCTAAPRRSCSPRDTRASGCPRWRRWPPARR